MIRLTNLKPTKNNLQFNLKLTLADKQLLGLWRLITGFHTLYLAAMVFVVITAATRAGTFLLMQYFVDDILAANTIDIRVIWVALGFILLAAGRGIFFFLSSTLAAHTAEGAVQRLRDFLFDHLQRLSYTYHDTTQTGELIQRTTSDVDAVRRFYAEQVLQLARIVALFLVNWLLLITLHLPLALLSVVVVPVVVAVSYWFFGKISKRYEEFQEQEATLSNTLQENLTGVRVVKAFARQTHELEKFERDNSEQYRRGRRLIAMHSLYWPVSDILCGGQILAGYIIGAIMALNGDISIGVYVAYSGMIFWIIFPMRNLGRVIVQMSTGVVSYERVTHIIKEDREPLEDGTHQTEDDLRGDVVFDGLSFNYKGSDDEHIPALHDISFRCQAGQHVALIGSTGSGKTSLVNLLPRFYDYTGGSIKLDGVELRDYHKKYLRAQIGTVEQEPFLFSRSLRENITYGVPHPVSDEQVEAAARAAAIHDVIIDIFPEGYDTVVGEKGVTLSGGQKQRIALARTLLKDPRILILDDATSSVDTETEESIRAALAALMEDRTTFIIAHRIQTVMNADLILVLDKGKIVQQGSHQELMQDEEGIYRRIYEVQARVEDELEKEILHG